MDILPGHTECGWATSARGECARHRPTWTTARCSVSELPPKTLRSEVQEQLEALNPDWHYAHTTIAPDGDVDLEGADYAQFELAHCKLCGGRLKPDVVFFGENVPRTRVETAMSELEQADALVVIGSSLSVFSGYRFVRAALKSGQPVYIVNDGETRADDDATLKISADARQVVDQLRSI